jgi:hypothetical protein
MITEQRRLLIDKWYNWAEQFLGRKFGPGERPTIQESNGETVPQFPVLTSSQEEMGKMVSKFEGMVRGKPE